MASVGKKAEFRIRVVESDGDPLPIRGALGGPTLDGLIIFRPYSERPGVAALTRYDVGTGGRVDLQKTKDMPDVNLVRTIHSTMVFSPHTAREIAKWLLMQAEKAEELVEQVGHNTDDSEPVEEKTR